MEGLEGFGGFWRVLQLWKAIAVALALGCLIERVWKVWRVLEGLEGLEGFGGFGGFGGCLEGLEDFGAFGGFWRVWSVCGLANGSFESP